jgi:hypothetical protein
MTDLSHQMKASYSAPKVYNVTRMRVSMDTPSTLLCAPTVINGERMRTLSTPDAPRFQRTLFWMESSGAPMTGGLLAVFNNRNRHPGTLIRLVTEYPEV